MNMQTILGNHYMQNLLDFIFPQLCLGCSEYSDNKLNICDACEKKIQKIKLPYCLYCMSHMDRSIKCEQCKSKTIALFSYATYDDPIREIIIQFKFKGITSPAQIFAKRIYEQYHELLKQYNADCLVPIPLYKYRENNRGYNQASILAHEFSKLSQIDVNKELIHRIKKRKPQAKLQIAERNKNIQSVFQVNSSDSQVLRCILVDDVVTTGNTVLEATKELEQFGHKVVAVISIAHAF